MPEIMLEVRNKTPTVIREQECIVADNSDYTMHFSFDDDWLPTAKTVFFVLDNGYAFEPRETVDDSVNVPLIKTDCARFLFVGLRQGDVKTTLPCSIRVLLSIAAKINDDAVQPDPSMWESVLKRLARLEAGSGSGGGVSFVLGETLELDNGVLNVKTTNAAERDNTLPITSSGVYTIVGNIGAVLDTI